MSVFGESVRCRRKALGMTQGQVASRIRLNRKPTTGRYICGLESGEIDPRLSTINSLARVFGVKPWQLVAGFEEPFWDDYLRLSPIGKREVQRTVKWYLERRR